ncbi:MAG: sigma-54-dependent Fis family transcriptional regulator [Verrucomicrobiae bacterium]|nr:sigma-54-dependent Fis family transcriptional regulator [Verrucomicrobiae bacterium]
MKNPTPSVLVVDDEFSVRDSLTQWFRKDGLDVTAAASADAALHLLGKQRFDVALIDVKMPGMDGMALQQHAQRIDPGMPVIIITAFASVETAVQALKQGAFDYVTKPIEPEELSHLVQRAVEQRQLKEENIRLRETIDGMAPSLDTIVGNSPPICTVREMIDTVAATDATVLIRGESGTGKELIARAIHARSRRRYFPIIPVNCGGLPDELLESELFGHEIGAFTGARQQRKGRIEMADGGTLFLDEVGAIKPRMQVDLLRVLETREFTRVGGSAVLQSDFRVICATNEDLDQAMAEGRLREDFYYRINVFTIEAPPLRERRGDIPVLAMHFLDRFARQMDKRFTGLNPAAMEGLVRADWPGNVRELSNAIERAAVIGRPPEIRIEDLPTRPQGKTAPDADDSLAGVEKRHIAQVLERTRWNVSQAAEVLGIDRVTVYNKIKKYGLRRA